MASCVNQWQLRMISQVGMVLVTLIPPLFTLVPPFLVLLQVPYHRNGNMGKVYMFLFFTISVCFPASVNFPVK